MDLPPISSVLSSDQLRAHLAAAGIKKIFPVSKKIGDGIFILAEDEKFVVRSYYTLVFIICVEDGFLKDDTISIILPMLLQYECWTQPQICSPTSEGYTSIFLNGEEITLNSLVSFVPASKYSMQPSMEFHFKNNTAGPSLLAFVYGDKGKGSFGARCQRLPVNPQTGGYKPIKIVHSRPGCPDRIGKYYFEVITDSVDNIECHQRIDQIDNHKTIKLFINRLDCYKNILTSSKILLPFDRFNESLQRNEPIEHDGFQIEAQKKDLLIEQPRFNIIENKLSKQINSNPLPILGKSFQYYNVYYGDLHVHCSDISSDALGSIDEVFQYGRDVAGLDFMAITDHAESFTPDLYKQYIDKTEKYNKEGEFVTFPGFEWTKNFSYGHKNVVFKDKPLPLPVSSVRKPDITWADNPAQLWKLLDNTEALTIPHFPMPAYNQIENLYPLLLPIYDSINLKSDHHQADWSCKHTELQRLVEITSKWGEYRGKTLSDHPKIKEFCSNIEKRANGIQEALKQGQILGFIGGSDQHSGRPGDGGVAGVLTRKKSRDSIWEGLRARRTFAATKHGMIICMKVMGFFMGSECNFNGSPPDIYIEAFGTNTINSLEIIKIKDGEIKTIAFYSPMSLNFVVNFIDTSNTGINNIYYSRIKQSDEEMAWTSPVWMKNI